MGILEQAGVSYPSLAAMSNLVRSKDSPITFTRAELVRVAAINPTYQIALTNYDARIGPVAPSPIPAPVILQAVPAVTYSVPAPSPDAVGVINVGSSPTLSTFGTGPTIPVAAPPVAVPAPVITPAPVAVAPVAPAPVVAPPPEPVPFTVATPQGVIIAAPPTEVFTPAPTSGPVAVPAPVVTPAPVAVAPAAPAPIVTPPLEPVPFTVATPQGAIIAAPPTEVFTPAPTSGPVAAPTFVMTPLMMTIPGIAPSTSLDVDAMTMLAPAPIVAPVTTSLATAPAPVIAPPPEPVPFVVATPQGNIIATPPTEVFTPAPTSGPVANYDPVLAMTLAAPVTTVPTTPATTEVMSAPIMLPTTSVLTQPVTIRTAVPTWGILLVVIIAVYALFKE